MTTPDWRDEYLKRVAEALVPMHAAHGFRSEVEWVGYDPSDCDTCGNGGSIRMTVKGDCPCGEHVYADVNGEEDVAASCGRSPQCDPKSSSASPRRSCLPLEPL